MAAGIDYHAADGVSVEGWVNGERRQASATNQLVFPIDRLIAHVSAVMTLLPGDVIATGTPAGIGSLKRGDRVTIRLEGAFGSAVQVECVVRHVTGPYIGVQFLGVTPAQRRKIRTLGVPSAEAFAPLMASRYVA